MAQHTADVKQWRAAACHFCVLHRKLADAFLVRFLSLVRHCVATWVRQAVHHNLARARNREKCARAREACARATAVCAQASEAQRSFAMLVCSSVCVWSHRSRRTHLDNARARESHMLEQCQDMDVREKDARMQIEMLAHAHTREDELEMQIDMLKAAWKHSSGDTYRRYFGNYMHSGGERAVQTALA